MSAPAIDAHRCLSQVMAVRLRVARLHADGTLDPGDENLYVTDSLISIGSDPDIEAGEVLTQRNGSGNICVRRRSNDETVAYNLSLVLCNLDAELLEMLTGATLLTVGGITVGLQRPKVGDSKPIVCVEAWAEAYSGTEQASFDGDLLYWHWVWPRVRWTAGAVDRSAAIATIPVNGYAEENEQMGLGPANDWPGLITAAEAFFLDDAVPPSVCGYQELVVAGSAS